MSDVRGKPLELDEITETHNVGVYCFLFAKVPMKSRQKGCFLQLTGSFHIDNIIFNLYIGELQGDLLYDL